MSAPLVAVVSTAFLVGALAGTGILGLRTVATAIGGVVVVVDAWLLFGRWRTVRPGRRLRELSAALDGEPSHAVTVAHDEASRDRLYTRLTFLAVFLVLLATAAPWVFKLVELDYMVGDDGRWPYRGMLVSAAAIVAVTHCSNLVDWAGILPTLHGLLGDDELPCRGGKQWVGLTRRWLLHRLAAHLIFRAGVAVIVGFGAFAVIAASRDTGKDLIGQPTAVIVGALGSGVIVAFLNRLLPLGALVTNPRLSVGDWIVLAEEYSAGVKKRPRYYVVDVAIEGVKLLEIGDDGVPERTGPDGPGRDHDRSLDLVDIPRLLRVRGSYTGCAIACSRVNHYCPHTCGHSFAESEAAPGRGAVPGEGAAADLEADAE